MQSASSGAKKAAEQERGGLIQEYRTIIKLPALLW